MGLQDGDFLLGDWTVQPGLNRLSRGTTSIQLEPKVMQVLLELARNAGRPVTRDELLERVWTETYVHEDVLSRSISELRKVLGDKAADPQFIETIRKVGYRLLVPVQRVGPETVPPTRRKPFWMGLTAIAAVLLAAAGLAALDALRPNDHPPLKPMRAVPLTTLPGREIDPAFSPDGRQLAFAWESAGRGHFDIYLQLLGSGTPVRLTQHPGEDTSPSFSPDGGQLAFVRQHQGGCGLYVMPALGGPEQLLTECTSSSALFPKWSPDGRSLLFSESLPTTGNRCIRLLSTQTMQATRPIACADEGDDLYPVFSPDGSQIAFVRSQGGQWLLLAAASDGSSPPRPLSLLPGKTLDLEWAPDGKKLVLVADDGNGFGVWTVSAQGGEPSWIPAGNGAVTDIALASNRLAFSDSLDDENIWRMELPPSPEAASTRPWISSSRWDSKPRLSPDGSKIAFQSTRSGEHGIWICNSDGSHPFQVAFLPDCVTRDPEWTADGQRILFATALEGQSEIYSVSTQGGPPQRLTFHPSLDMDPQASPDGLWIYFRSKRSGNWEIWRLSTSGGDLEQVTQRASIAAFSLRAQGRIYFSRIGQPGLWQRNESGSFALLLADLNSYDRRNWTVSQDGVYHVHRPAFSQPQLAFYDFAAQQSVILAPLEAISSKSGLTVSPRSDYLLYSRVDLQESDILMLEEFQAQD